MNSDKTNEQLEYERRVHAEMLDSFDEELEMEIDDDRMNELVAEAMIPPEQSCMPAARTAFKVFKRSA